jgi:uncharacterized membrane protein
MPSQARTYAVSVMVALASLLGLVNDGHAFNTHVSFCNHTPDPVEVAVGYDAEGTSETTSRGWFSVAACACHDIINAQTRATEFFTLVTKKGSDTVISSGQAPLCVHPTQGFRFVGENASRDSCHRAGGRWLNFSFHDTKGATSFKTNFNPSDGHHCNLD